MMVRKTSRKAGMITNISFIHAVNCYVFRPTMWPSSGIIWPPYLMSLIMATWLTETCSSSLFSFIHSVFSLTTGSKPPAKRCLHVVRSRASSFKWQYPLLSLRSSNSFLRLLPRLLVISIFPFIFPSITCFRMQFLRKMWPIQLAFRFIISCRVFLCSLTLSNTSSFLTWSVHCTYKTNFSILRCVCCCHYCVWSLSWRMQR